MARTPAQKAPPKKVSTRKTPTGKAGSKKDPFAEFDDWLKNGPATTEDRWTSRWEKKKKELTKAQKRIVDANANLLLDRDGWAVKVEAFEQALSTIADVNRRKAKRTQYEIRFDQYNFGDHKESYNFIDYYFPCSISFIDTVFGEGDVWFYNATFADGDTSFNRAEFGEGDISFQKAIFGDGDVSFESSVFGIGDVHFSRVKFGDGDVAFSEASFGEGNVSFVGSVFGVGNISFSAASFSKGRISFSGASFGDGYVFFNRAKFGESLVSFDWIRIGEGHVWFTGATFGEGSVTLNGATFGKGTVSFTPETLDATIVSASDTIVEGNLIVKATFPRSAIFRRLKVTETADFSGCTFAEIPDFRDAKFDRAPEVANITVPSPKMTWYRSCLKDHTYFYKIPWLVACDIADVAKLRKLKAMALAANDHEMDGDFFAKEMLAKRGVETTTWTGLAFNSLYYWLSNFGQSFLRPIGWMALSIAGFAVHYGAEVSPILTGTKQFWFAAELSLRNSIPFLGSLVRFAPSPTDHVSEFQKSYNELEAIPAKVDSLIYAGVLQSIIGAVLLFLLLLALRNRFRLK